MYYQDIGYISELYNKLQKIKTKITDPNVQLFWRQSNTSQELLTILAGLSYFTGINTCFKRHKLGRNDNIAYMFDAIERNMSASRFIGIESRMYDENTPYTNLIINLVYIPYQITTSFEQTIPEYVRAQNYTELNAFSLALKTSPRHRVRVYTRNTDLHDVPVKIITIFSATDYTADDCILLRKIGAILPLLSTDPNTTTQTSTIAQARAPLFRMLETTTDASIYLRTALEFLNTLSAFVDLEMKETLSTLQHLNKFHQRNVERQINVINNDLVSVEERLRQLLLQQRELQYELAGMSDTSLTESDLKMLINKQIINRPQLDGEVLIYVCKAPCLSFDKSAAIAYYKRLDNKASTFARLFKLAFIDEKIILNFEDVIKINFKDIHFTGRSIPSSYPYNSTGFRNPHHKHFDCWGNYGELIRKLIQQYDFMQLFLQIKAAVGSINLVDYTVLNRFHDDINSHYYNETRYDDIAPFIIWKDEQDSTKLHSIHETLTFYNEGDASNETN